MSTDTNVDPLSRVNLHRPQTVGGVLDALAGGSSAQRAQAVRPVRTGFDLVDRVLDGGLRVHDLMLLGGAPGAGKTVASLQMARHIAISGRTAIYVCYEHDAPALLGRLLCLELGELATAQNAPELDLLRGIVLETAAGFRDLQDVLATEPLVRAAYERIREYAGNLWLVRGSGAHTGLPEVRRLLDERAQHGSVLFIDYLQKVAVRPEPADEADKVTRIAEGLKEIALSHSIAVVATVAADKEGVKAPRLRMHHLRGSSALAYECDAAVILNDKHRIVSKVHLAYDPVRAETFKHNVVFSIEKNRGGPALVDLEFRKDFHFYRFESQGSYVADQLVDERLTSE